LRGAPRSHRPTIKTASTVHARLSDSSTVPKFYAGPHKEFANRAFVCNPAGSCRATVRVGQRVRLYRSVPEREQMASGQALPGHVEFGAPLSGFLRPESQSDPYPLGSQSMLRQMTGNSADDANGVGPPPQVEGSEIAVSEAQNPVGRPHWRQYL
jgi:hypothetical protein